MLTRTTGSKIPFRTCDQIEISISGASGIRIIMAEIIRIPV